ncbi:MAG: hypothetical protein IPL84_02235 [Chitinophagaceae bacterium]|nr:hypothetical protein [Chitinophagaceae bacterium]
MYKLPIILLFVCVSFVSKGQLIADSGRTNLNRLCDRFMQTFSTGKYSDAFQLLKQQTSMDKGFVDNLNKTLNEQMENILVSFKKITGYELIEEKSINNVLVRRRYLLKLELYFLSFDFYLYNNGSNWLLSGFYYSDNQQALF